MEVFSDSSSGDGRLDDLLTDLAAIQVRLDVAIREGMEQRRRMQIVCTNLDRTMRNMRAAGGAGDPFAPIERSESEDREPELRRLTDREREVLRLVAQGFSTKEIAQTLKISFKTVVTHRTHLLRKLHLHESASLVRIAIRAGLVAA